jgi:hypothetical protein
MEISNNNIIKISLRVFFALILLIPGANTIYSQGMHGLKGFEIKPHIFIVRNLPSLGDVYMGPVIKQDFNEAEPPYAPPYPSPDISILPKMTFDKGENNTGSFAPTTGINFEGITQSGYIPSEPQPAVGPNHVFILGNVSVKITDKSGNTLKSVTQLSFFNIPSAENPGFDAKCFYDYRRQRFLALCETKTTSPAVCNYYLAISATSDAMGTWYIYKFDMTKDGTTQTTNWSDFPGLGISDDKLVMSGQQFTFSGNSYQYQKLRVIDRAVAYTGGTLPAYVDFYNWSGNVFVTKPGRNMSPGNDIYLLATLWNGGTYVEFRKITGTPSSPILSNGTNITVSAYGIPPDAPGGSSAVTVNTGDCRTPDFFVRNGILNIAFHVGITINSTNVSAIKYLRLDVNPLNTTPRLDETYGAANTFYYYPMVCVDSLGTMFMGFGKSSVSEYPSSYVTGKRRTDASIQSSVLAKSGLAVTNQSRWGDYSGIDMDEAVKNPGISYAWYSGQYTKAASNFGTWVTQLSFTYGQIAGQVLNDADGDITTTGDRTPVQGVTIILKQGSTTLNTKISDASGNYNFGYLETASNYSVEFSPPYGKYSIDVIPGSGGISQTKINYKTITVNLTNSQTSNSNNFIVSDWLISVASGNWNNPVTWADNTVPSVTEKLLIAPEITVTANNNYTCQNLNDKGALIFDNISPWTITISNTLNLANGTILLGNNNIIAGNITGASPSNYINTNGSGQLKMNILNNATYVFFPIGQYNSYNPVNIQLNTASTPDLIGARVSNNISNAVYSPTEIIQKEWNITEGTPGGSNITIQFFFGSSDFGTNFNPGLSPNLYDIGHFNTLFSTYQVFPGIISGPVSGLYAITNTTRITGLSPFVVGNYNSIQGPLPVELVSFSSSVSEREVKLNWTTAYEINNSGFEIQKMIFNGLKSDEWIYSGYIKGKGTTNTMTNYTFNDKKLNTGKYKYRLKQIDNNGNFEYHNLAETIVIGNPDKYKLLQNYPNPFNSVTKIEYSIQKTGFVTLKIYDISGKEVKTLVNTNQEAGYYEISFDAYSLSSGVYFYRITANNFVETKKMLLLK